MTAKTNMLVTLSAGVFLAGVAGKMVLQSWQNGFA